MASQYPPSRPPGGILPRPVSEENLETLDRIYEGWERGDFRVGVADFAPDATLVIDPEIPDAGEYDGLEGIRNYMTHFLSAWESLTIKAQSFRESADDTILVQVDQNGIGQGSGAPATLNYFHIWTFRDDGKVIRLESILREAKALEAAGLPEDQGPAAA
jgi:ketosteroid isomerase-like protein